MTSAEQRICILGAESTGKTTLAQALSSYFVCPWVPEYLREFCQNQGRTPWRQEQEQIMKMQADAENGAAAQARQAQQVFVFCDTAPLMTAIYSEFIFADKSLLPAGRALHTHYALTLLLAPDIAWVADSMQRDGAHVRAPVHQRIHDELRTLALPFALITGLGDKRLANALQVIESFYPSSIGQEHCTLRNGREPGCSEN